MNRIKIRITYQCRSCMAFRDATHDVATEASFTSLAQSILHGQHIEAACFTSVGPMDFAMKLPLLEGHECKSGKMGAMELVGLEEIK